MNSFTHRMDVPIQNVIDDVILEIFRYLTWIEILAFGSTNIRFFHMVAAFIETQQRAHGPIHFHLAYNEITRTFLQLFGRQFQRLCLNSRIVIDMNIFNDFDGSLMSTLQQLNLTFNAFEIQHVIFYGGYYQFDDPNYLQSEIQLDQWENQYRLSLNNIIESINNNEMPRLNVLRFAFVANLTVRTYNAQAQQFIRCLEIASLQFFGILRRGSVSCNSETHNQYHRVTHTITFILNQ